MTYKKIADITSESIQELEEVVENASWKTVQGSGADFKTWHGVISQISHIKELADLWPIKTWEQAFFLNIPSGGAVHRHSDTPRAAKTYHIPIQTNNECVNYMYSPEREDFHLEIGGVYYVDRQIEHESINLGKTDRIHLLLEMNELLISDT